MILRDSIQQDKRHAIWAGAVLAVALAVSAVISMSHSSSGNTGSKSEPAFPDVLTTPRQIQITTSETSYLIENRDLNWILPEAGDFPADMAKITQLLDVIENGRLEHPRSRRSEWFNKLGLEDPAEGGNGARITLPSLDETGLIVGVKDGRTYLRRSGSDQVWRSDRPYPSLHSARWWLDLDALDLPSGGTVREVKVITYDDNAELTVRADKPSLSSTELALLDASQTMRVVDVTWYEAEVMTPYAEHTVSYEDGTSMTIILMRYRSSIWAEFSGSAVRNNPLTAERVFRLDPISASELLP